jgi:hypothetical protein
MTLHDSWLLRTLRSVLLAALTAWTCGHAAAQVPHVLNYQGLLTTSGGAPITGPQLMTFRLYNVATNGAALYPETQLAVPVINGIFNAVIGSVTTLALPFDVPYWLSVQINADPEMGPRQQVTASAYALRSAIADALAPAATLAGSQVTGSITVGTLPTTNLTGTIGTAQIANNAVTQAKLSPLSGAVPGKVLGTDGTNLVWQTDAVGTGGTVTSVTATGGGGLATTPGGGITAAGSVGIAAGGVQTGMLADGAVTDVKVASNISGAKIATGSIPTDRLASSQQLPACFDGQVIRRSAGVWICGNLPPTINTVDGFPNGVGSYTSIAISTDGLPVVSYFDTSNLALKVAKCLTASCTGTTATTLVDSIGDVGRYSSIAIGMDGFPVVGYYDATNSDLKVAKCINAACTGSATITTVNSVADVGQYTSIAIGTDGFPVLSYYENTSFNLKVAKCINPACTGSATITTVDSAGSVGAHTSIAIGADGFPVVSYYDNTNDDLKVAKCINAACTGSATITAVDSVGIVGFYTSIAIGVDGFPVVSYYDQTNSSLKVAKCINAACTGSATITLVDNSAGQYTSIAIGPDAFPVISYYSSTTSSLKVAKCGNAACTGNATISTLDSAGTVGRYNAIAIGADGLPVISYEDGTNGALKVVKCSNAACVVP